MPLSNPPRDSVYSLSTFLTDAKVARLNNSSGPQTLFARDNVLRGFGVKVSPLNTKSFFVESRTQGNATSKPRRIVFGRFPLITVKEARQKALEALRDLKYGDLPSTRKERSEASLQALVKAFLADKQSVLRPSTLTDYSLVLRGDYFSDWMDVPVQRITRRAVLDRYQKLCSENGAGMANKSMRVLSSVLNYGKAIEPSLEEWANPLRVLSEARARKQLKPRTGHIPPAKLADWFSALDTYVNEARSDLERERRSDIRFLFTLIIMTGLRSNEARSLQWSQINIPNGTLEITSEQAKNHQAIVLPLNSWLIGQLRERRESGNGRSPYVFGGKSQSSTESPSKNREPAEDGGSPYLENLRRAHTRIGTLAGVPFTPHDLRRSFATYLDLTGAPFSAIKQLLNHVSSADVTSRYIQLRSLDNLGKYSEAVNQLIERARHCGTQPMTPSVPAPSGMNPSAII